MTIGSEALRRDVWLANQVIPEAGLAQLTWGNVSGVDREGGFFLIKPSGVSYGDLTADMLVPVNLETGKVLAGDLRPSVDTESHRAFYLAWPSIGGITHTHSTNAVAFAQANRDIPVLGTTHADTFNGPVPVTRGLTAEECAHDYEFNTGRVIIELIGDDEAAAAMPAALVANHGPFTWGVSPKKSVEHAIIVEAVADMAIRTLAINPQAFTPQHLQERHFKRKHGPGAYYGNPGAAKA
ncbi:L-ribulose-5-phosphate 4-epimerase [Actinoplanes sp. SE50]|uniref:L-ribulose-5-phosphate 4-epimerase AraD n=1 Tax=unclassified Actinoplanes TaxID=2626549 RepID=UPI00023EC144|nr:MULTISPECIES: L-ribulose-5-phosphate 4-epimerase AraD [unclassified Actinoplanes]AEV86335.1 L-ribulose-5-phosphate 4-epimerase [Actinoplanes sp. SE50/110]ATO84732.1 L-ribulose-5-phosphate 4-epimerase [Actinoplanes sp. SE50]SLM02142.1 L-ribulose-5-phosphate 4-epimerase [Actinoplanes sp. SE50/110]